MKRVTFRRAVRDLYKTRLAYESTTPTLRFKTCKKEQKKKTTKTKQETYAETTMNLHSRGLY